jgi:hypothetical protein
MGLLPTAAAILGSVLGYKSSTSAAKRAADAQNMATEEAKRQFNILLEQNAPFLAAKTKAVQDISRLADTTFNPAALEKQFKTEYGRATSAAGQTADMALGNRGLAGAAIGAKMRSGQGAVESGLKAKRSAADTFLSVLSPILGENAMGTAMAGASALSSAAQTNANTAAQSAYAQNEALQGLLGPLGSLVEEWANKDMEARLQAKLEELNAKMGVGTFDPKGQYKTAGYTP